MPVIEDVQLLVTQIVADLVKVNVVLRVRQAAPFAEILVLIVVLYAEMLVETAVDMVAVQRVLLDVATDAKAIVVLLAIKNVVPVQELVEMAAELAGDNVLMDVATDAKAIVVLLAIKDVVPVQELVEMAAELAGMFVQKDVEMDAILLAELLVIKDAQKLVILIVLIVVKVNVRDTVKGVVQMAAQKDAQLPLAFLQ